MRRTIIEYLISQNSSTNLVKNHKVDLIRCRNAFSSLRYQYKEFRKNEQKAQKVPNAFQNYSPNSNTIFLPNVSAYYERCFSTARAYLNECAHIEKIITSQWLKEYLENIRIGKMLPTFLAVQPLRQKWAAHNAIDYPHNKESLLPTELAIQNKSIAMLDVAREWKGSINSPGMLAFTIDVISIFRHKDLESIPLIESVEEYKDQPNLYSVCFIPSLHHPKIENELGIFFEILFQQTK